MMRTIFTLCIIFPRKHPLTAMGTECCNLRISPADLSKSKALFLNVFNLCFRIHGSHKYAVYMRKQGQRRSLHGDL